MKQPTEQELHAYVDRQLSVARRTEVDAWLATHQEDEAKVCSWARQNQRLHETFDGVLNEPVPSGIFWAHPPIGGGT